MLIVFLLSMLQKVTAYVEWNSVVVYSNCICSSASRCSLTMTVFIMFRIAWWTSAGKKLTSWLSACVAFLYAVLIVCVPFPYGI